MGKLAIDMDFLRDFGRLPRPTQAKVAEVFGKFQEATHTGLHLEKIRNVRDDRLHSIRIDQFWRGVVLAPDAGDVYLLLTVRPHDEAYAWAQRRTVSVNAARGVIEIRDVQEIEDRLPELQESASDVTARLFEHLKDSQLRGLGIDDQVLEFARALSYLDQLEAARGTLPEAQYDALLGLALGLSVEDVWAEVADTCLGDAQYDTDDLAGAFDRSGDRIVVINGPDELMEVFSYPFDRWRIFLHPSQQRAAYGSFSGPARVTGGPGTGKTVAAMHRAKHLASTSSADRSILLTTFTRNLASSLEDALRLLTEDEDLIRRIDVRNLDQVANRIVSAEHGRLNLLGEREEREWWELLTARRQLDASGAFLAAEWREVVLAQELSSRNDYLAAARNGRGRPLGTQQREQVWEVLSDFAVQLKSSRRWTHETVCIEAARTLQAREIAPYRHVIVDEAQDLSPWQWRLVRALVKEGPDDVFIAGDSHQRIYNHRVSLRRLGISISGRSTKLKINYRTTAEILGWSFGILTGEPLSDLDGELDSLSGCRSDVHGAPPVLYGEAVDADELRRLVTTVQGWLAQGMSPAEIGVAARTVRLVELAAQALQAAQIPTVVLGGQGTGRPAVQAGTMHRMKGLEFRGVAVVGADAAHLPLPAAVTPIAEDEVSHRLDVQRERCLLFVACTRAREQLAVIWNGVPSRLLPIRR